MITIFGFKRLIYRSRSICSGLYFCIFTLLALFWVFFKFQHSRNT